MSRTLSPIAASIGALSLLGCTVQPTPLTEADIDGAIKEDLISVSVYQKPVVQELDIYGAMARAVTLNLDEQVAALEVAIARRQFGLTKLDTLPKVIASAGYDVRSNKDASNSFNLTQDTRSTDFTFSDEQSKASAGLSVTWSAIDFGLSYARARQSANQILIIEETRRKALHRLLSRTREAFWRAYAAQQLEDDVNLIAGMAAEAIQRSETAMTEGVSPAAVELSYQKEMLKLLGDVAAVQSQLAQDKVELNRLINAPPGAIYRLKGSVAGEAPDLDMNAMDIASATLRNAPEYREEVLNVRNAEIETDKALLQLLPGIDLSASANYDGNSFQLNSTFLDFAAQITFNLLGILSAEQIFAQADAQIAVAKARRLVRNMALVTQGRLAALNYELAKSRYERAQRISDIDDRLASISSARAAVTAGSEADKVADAVDAVRSKMQKHEAYAELQVALGNVIETLGLDPIDVNIGRSLDVAATRTTLETSFKRWDKGEMASDALQSFDVSQPALLRPATSRDAIVKGSSAADHALRSPPGAVKSPRLDLSKSAAIAESNT